MAKWQSIFDKALTNYDIIYIAIGSAMGEYSKEQITDDKNQQFPPFLNKFGRKMIILIDPQLEEYLAIEYYMKKHNLQFEEHKENNIRILRNEEIIVFAIKDYFYFVECLRFPPEENQEKKDKLDYDLSNLINLITICLNNLNTKIILQDFTGRNTTLLYTRLFNFFDKKKLLNRVLFDVTQKEGGCFIEMNEFQAPVDSKGNFIQERYLELTAITNHKKFLKKRIDQIIYPISQNFTSLKKNPSFEIMYKDIFYILAQTYNIDFDELNINPDYLIKKYEKLIKIVIADIVTSCNGDFSMVDDLFNIIDQRDEFRTKLRLFNVL